MKKNQLHIRMTDEELELVKAKCKALGVNRSKLFLDTMKGISVENYLLKKAKMISLIKVASEINKVGVNINQIAMKLNNIEKERHDNVSSLLQKLEKELPILQRQLDTLSTEIKTAR